MRGTSSEHYGKGQINSGWRREWVYSRCGHVVRSILWTIVLFSQRPATRKYCVRVNVPHGIQTWQCDTAVSTMGVRFSKSNLHSSRWARSLCPILSTWPAWRTSRLILSDGNLRSDARVAHFKTLIKNKRGTPGCNS